MSITIYSLANPASVPPPPALDIRCVHTVTGRRIWLVKGSVK